MPSASVPSAWPARALLAVLGGYALSSALVAGLAALLRWLGMAAAEAVVLSAVLGFPLYLVALCWAFSAVTIGRLWLWLGALPALAWALILVGGR